MKTYKSAKGASAKGASAKGAKSAKVFEGLVEELEMVQARPYAPDPPAAFKQELRGQLLQTYERSGLSGAERGRLWRFAGTAVALLLLVMAVGLFWSAISSRGTAVGPAADTVNVPTRTAVPATAHSGGEIMPDITVARFDNLAVQVGEYLRLTDFTLNQSHGSSTRMTVLSDGTEIPFESKGNELRLSLTWQVLTPLPHDDFTLMFHLKDDTGNIVQAYNTHVAKRPQPWSTWREGEQISDVYILPIGDEVAAGHYALQLSLYDSRTDVWLPVQTGEKDLVVVDGTAVQLADWQYHPDFSATFAESDVVSASNSPASVLFADGIGLQAYDLAEQENGLQLTLHWQPPTDWPEAVRLFVHLRNEEGELVRQVDVPLSKSEQDTVLLASLPDLIGEGDVLLDGRYDIIIGLYDPVTGQRLPVTADNERMLADEGTAIWLTDWMYAANSHLCGSGFYDGTALTVNQISCTHLGNEERILSLLQKARPSANSPVELEATVGYELVTEEEVFLKLHYAAPDWETVVDGRVPIDGMGDWVPLNPDGDSIIITFTSNPNEMTQIVGTAQPVLVVQLGYFVDGVNGRELKILSSQTFTDYPFDLSSSDEVRYGR